MQKWCQILLILHDLSLFVKDGVVQHPIQIQVLPMEVFSFSARVHWLVFSSVLEVMVGESFMSSFHSWYQSSLSQALLLLSHKTICLWFFSYHLPSFVCPMTWWDTEAYALKWTANSRICSGLWARKGSKLKAPYPVPGFSLSLGKEKGRVEGGCHVFGETMENTSGGLLVTTPFLSISVIWTVGLAENGK